MNHENAFSHFHYGGDYMLTERFTPSLLSHSLPLSRSLFRILPLCCNDRLVLPIHFPVPVIYSSHVFTFCLPVKANQRPAMCLSQTDVNIWSTLMSSADVSIWLVYKSITESLFLLAGGTHLKLNKCKTVSQPCGFTICSAECFTVVMLRL